MDVYCPECEAANAEDAPTCTACGHRLLSPRREIDAVRVAPWAGLGLACGLVVYSSYMAHLDRSAFVGSMAELKVAVDDLVNMAKEPCIVQTPLVHAPPVTPVDSSLIPEAEADPTVSLEEAMMTAAAQLDPEVICDPQFRPCRKNSYRERLAKGEPVVLGGMKCRAMSMAFAVSLSDAHREEWLRRCFGFTMNEKMNQGQPGGGRWPLSFMFEAIFNLTKDVNLKHKAHQQWEACELARFADAEQHHRQSLAMARATSGGQYHGHAPRRNPIPVWKQ